MKYIIMAAGDGKRWNNYLGKPKHLIEINGETLLERTTRLLKENGINDYVITGNDERYAKYGKLIPQSNHDCEIDRFEEVNEPVCYLYGDVYYTDLAMRIITKTNTDEIMFFGSFEEIFAIKIHDYKKFYQHKNQVKQYYLQQRINRCIGWEVYRSLGTIDFRTHEFNGRYTYILDDTNDFDYPSDLVEFNAKMEERRAKDESIKI